MKTRLSPIGHAIVDLIENYDIAKGSTYVKKPISYALYHTWKKWDKKEEEKDDETKDN